MAVVCPAILADSPQNYRSQMDKVGHFAERIQIDLTDGEFASSRTVGPEDAWWPVGVMADFHLMYRRPDRAIQTILQHQPHMIIVHAEADGQFASFAQTCHQHGVKIGVAVLPKTPIESILEALHAIDHVLIFSGDLGHFGGHANLDMLSRVHLIKQHRPDMEVGWDGGINEQNISRLATGGVDVLNVGGKKQKNTHPEQP
jgi:ribulose-phosphate 3-epimerase